jgi:hypothetical protein
VLFELAAQWYMRSMSILRRQRWSAVAMWSLAGLAAIAFALAYAAPIGTSNQATYLLDPLKRASPHLFARDWFVSDTPPYLPLFGWVTQIFYRIAPDGAVPFLAAHVIATAATFAAICWVTFACCRSIPAFMLVAAFTAVSMGRSLGGSYLIAGYLQPSSLATLGWLVALAALVQHRWLLCGIVLAAAGAMHVNFLVLGFPLFGMSAVAVLWRDTNWRERVRIAAKLFGPQLIVFAIFAPGLLRAAGPNAEQLRILVDFHAPGHYAGVRLANWLPVLLAWQLAALAVWRLVDCSAVRVLWKFSLVACGICVVSTLLILIPSLESLTQLRWSRIGPFGQLACQVIVASAIVKQFDPSSDRAIRRTLLIIGVTAVAISVHFAFLRIGPLVHCVTVGTIAIALLASRRAFISATGLATVLVAAALATSPRGAGLTTRPAGTNSELALFEWIRSHTPVDALFMTPPEIGRFRLLAHRAIIADSKSPPLRPDLLAVWYQRLCAMVGVTHATSTTEIENRYRNLPIDRLVEIARSLDADYVVTQASEHVANTVFTNNAFHVIEISR